MPTPYTTGTVSVGAGDTVVVGTDTIWTSANVEQYDRISIDGGPDILITEVADATHLSIPPWSGSAKTNVDYVIYPASPRRVDSVEVADDLRKQVQALNTTGYYIFVPAGQAVPDPSLGDEGQAARQFSTGKEWHKASGVWVFDGVFKGLAPAGAYDPDISFSTGQIVSSGGGSYISRVDGNIGHDPATSPDQWMVNTEPGERGADGSEIIAQASTPDTSHAPGSIWIDSDSADVDVYELSGSPLAWTDTGVNLRGIPGIDGTDGLDGADGATIFVQTSAPSTSHPSGSLWVDSDSADNDVFSLTGSPLAWTDTGLNLKGAQGVAGSTAFASGLVAPQITSNQNNYSPTGLSAVEVLQINSDAARSISGLATGASGRIMAVMNIGSFPITLLNESASSTAANRFTFSADIVLAPQQSAQLRYDSTTSRWQIIAATAGGSGSDTDRRNILLDRIYQSKLYGGYRRFLNAFADGYKASDGINAGASSNYTVDTSGGKVLPTSSGGTDQLPTMTAATTSGVTISASSSFGAGYEAWHASDKVVGTNATGSHWASANTTMPITWTVDFGSGNTKTITQYTIQPRGTDGAANAPSAWTFQGSNNGSSWTTLDTQSGVTSGWGAATVRTFPAFVNATAYRYYQFVFTAAVSGASFIAVTEFTLLTPVVPANMTVVTASQTADASVSNGRVLLEYDNTANPTLNTDLTVEVTCDGGTNWTAASLSSVSTNGQAGRKIVETVDQACTAGTSFAARIKTLNNKNVPIYGTSLTVH